MNTFNTASNGTSLKIIVSPEEEQNGHDETDEDKENDVDSRMHTPKKLK